MTSLASPPSLRSSPKNRFTHLVALSLFQDYNNLGHPLSLIMLVNELVTVFLCALHPFLVVAEKFQIGILPSNLSDSNLTK